MLEQLHRLRHGLGVDRPVFYSLVGRAWSLFSGPITLLLIAQYFDPKLQGYFYTFGSLMGLQVFLEMGFSQCIVQFASHEFAHLRFLPKGILEGDPKARTRLLSLGRLALRWYGVMACLLVVGIGVGGHWFFWAKHDPSVPWALPWWCLCVTAGLTLAILPVGALLEGCNQLSFLYGLRTLSAMHAAVGIWVALWAGAGLFAGSVAGLASALVMAIAYGWRWPGLLKELWPAQEAGAVSWRHEIWPLQWKIAVSWMSGYFITNLFTPVLFYFHGSVIAGQMGMTLQLINSLNGLAAAWPISKGPTFGVLISQRKFDELDRLYCRVTIQAVGACLAGGAVLLLALMFVRQHFALGARFLGLGPTSLLVLATVVYQVTVSQSIYLRAHKREPFMVLFIVNGLAAALLVTGLGWAYAAWGACLGYAVVQMVVVVWATLIWRSCRRRWHQTDQASAELPPSSPPLAG